MISIIIPIYNVASYLNECIQSIINQTHKDFECILVDDGSSDGSEKICDQWKTKDNRIKVIHQTNQGVSSARNRGLSVAKGEYIAFIDSDDWVDTIYLEKLYQKIISSNVDLVVCGIIQHYPNQSSRKYFYNEGVISLNETNIQAFVDLNKQFLLFGPVVKLYKKSIIQQHHLVFPLEYSYGEDLLFNYRYLEHVTSIYVINQCYYHYRILGNGTLSSIKRIEQFQTDYEQWKVLKDFYQKHKMWNTYSATYLYDRLWWCIYDSILAFPKLLNGASMESQWNYIKNIVNIPEVNELSHYTSCIKAPIWLKKCIFHRMYRTLWSVLTIKNNINKA